MRTTGSPELLSVVIAVRDGERFLGEAIESILAQGYEPLELVVVDDGSKDRSAEVARSCAPDARVVSQPPLGIGAAVNHGVELTRGALLAFVDADDLWALDKLALQTPVLAERRELDAVFGHVEHFAGDDRKTVTVASQPGYARGTMVIRRAAYDRVGPFSTEFRLAEFIDWWGRAVDLGLASLMLPDVCLLRRVHDTNLGVRMRNDRGDYVRVLKSALDRRRAASGE
ncbi:MAG TPA: glycosyltransferase family A protein [Gaiellaceae bacterium]|jgi:glycosyltransferase involved in cell wall biosynthesis|nr:glycosyltransferase family A protein [Gaiellaceae bacterium]